MAFIELSGDDELRVRGGVGCAKIESKVKTKFLKTLGEPKLLLNSRNLGRSKSSIENIANTYIEAKNNRLIREKMISKNEKITNEEIDRIKKVSDYKKWSECNNMNMLDNGIINKIREDAKKLKKINGSFSDGMEVLVRNMEKCAL